MRGAFAEYQTEQHPILQDSDRGRCVKANRKDLWDRSAALHTGHKKSNYYVMPYVLVSRSQTSCLSVSMCVCVINSCAQIMHAIRILRSRRWMMPNYNLSTAQWSSLNLHIPPVTGGASPLHRTGNALKVFCVAAVGKICTLLTNPRTQIVEKVRYDTIVEFNVDSIA